MSFGGGFPRFLCVCVFLLYRQWLKIRSTLLQMHAFFVSLVREDLCSMGCSKHPVFSQLTSHPTSWVWGASSLCFGRRAESSTGLIEMTKIRRMGFAQHKVCKYINMYTLMLYLLGQCDTESEHLCSAAFLRNSTGTKRL